MSTLEFPKLPKIEALKATANRCFQMTFNSSSNLSKNITTTNHFLRSAKMFPWSVLSASCNFIVARSHFFAKELAFVTFLINFVVFCVEMSGNSEITLTKAPSIENTVHVTRCIAAQQNPKITFLRYAILNNYQRQGKSDIFEGAFRD